ncbi:MULTISPECIES: hypothetical protein [Streptosporangium]|uniref:Uncharacterized protein n=1 Tax=Streptosporangium brasiliense TaxID=47480 RepID=A0ABT9RMB4_9ACTN|nr:hypothetical protein [Streptosporangium brasiliense]MDP9870437.1 hypothetical protein [Streptosporangium brasiliense]
MSSFWERKLNPNARPQAPQTPAYAPQASASRPWWDPTPPYPPTPQQPQSNPAAEVDPAPYVAPRQAQSAKLTETCPDVTCGSVNYMAPPGTSARKRCYDCGYPLVQAGSGGGGLPSGQGGPATPATQVHDGTSQYNSGNIIGRIG